MLRDAGEIADGAVLSGDVCIVGAGAAGITIARALRTSGLDVLLLESGRFEPDDETTALLEGENVGQPLDGSNRLNLDAVRLRYFGGTTNHWAGWCKPLLAADLDARADVGRPGWPIAYDELARWYPEAHQICGVGPFESAWSWWESNAGAPPALFADGAFTTTAVQISSRPRFGVTFRADLVDAPRITVCASANVRRVALASDGSHVDRLDVVTLSGRRFTARARAYVLATGGIEVPRLLLASNDVHSAGVGNGHDLVGRYFSEHLRLAGGYIALAPGVDRTAFFNANHYRVADTNGDKLDLDVLAVITPSAELQRSRGLLAFDIGPIIEVFPMDASSLPQKRRPDVADVAELAGVIEGKTYASKMAIRIFAEQAGDRDSRVSLAADRDALGMPRAQLDWRISRVDRESIVRGLGVLATELGRRQLGRVRLVFEGESPASLDPAALDRLDFGAECAFHHMGTTRMHSDATHGVVDANCRVHDVANLYVAGCAVFPSAATATPTMTLVALALRLAAHLRASLDRGADLR